MKRLFSCLILACAIISLAPAQNSLAQYHPLAVGNVWIYSEFSPPSRTWYVQREIVGDSLISGKYYNIVAETNTVDFISRISVERYDTSTGCYYTRGVSQDFLEDSTLAFTPKTHFGGPVNRRVFERLDTEKVLQTQTTTRQISDNTGIAEQVTSWSYSNGLGLVNKTETDLIGLLPIYTMQLVYANIEGKVYGAIPVSVRSNINNVPASLFLSRNYPNPFNPTTTIKFTIPIRAAVNLNVYDVLGREIQCLLNETLNPGEYVVQWNAANFPSGLYFYRLVVGSYSHLGRMVLVK